MSRQNLSRAQFKYFGRVAFNPYQGNKPGIENHITYAFTPAGILPISFTAPLAAGAITATLTAVWPGATDSRYQILLSTGQVIQATLTNGSTAVTFNQSNFVAATAAAGSVIAAATISALVGPQQPGGGQPVGGVPPALAVANGYCLSQSVTISVPAVLNGTLVPTVTIANPQGAYQPSLLAAVTAGVGTPDIPRNVVAAWTGTAILTVTGTDYYGQPQTEVSASGTAFTGKKAFSTVTSLVFSASVTAATVGTGAVLGLPFRVDSGDIFATTLADAADAGTFVKADLTNPATSSTGDVRGTYTTAGALNSQKWLAMILTVGDDSTVLGAFGQTPA